MSGHIPPTITLQEETPRTIRERQLEVLRERWRRTVRTNLKAWCEHALQPYGQVPARHHRFIISALERVSRGETTRQMIFMPPGSAKSTYASQLFPAWFFAQRRGYDIIGASHTASLAEDFSRRVIGFVREHQTTLGYSLISENPALWRTSNKNLYRAAGVGGNITGRRADLVIIDDPIPGRSEAESPTFRETVWNWYRAEVLTRLKPHARIVLIMTRWHEDDLAARLLNAMQAGEGDKWEVLSLPAICDEPDDIMGRVIGQPLWPEYHDMKFLDEKKLALGVYEWTALYQQKPRPPGGAFFEEQDLLYFGGGVDYPIPTDCVFTIIDTAVKTGQAHDGLAVTHFAQSPYQSYKLVVLDWDITQIDAGFQLSWLPTVLARGEELARMTRARRGYIGAIIEDKATGSTLISQGQYNGWPVHAIESKLTQLGKVERAINAATYVRGQLVKFSTFAYDKVTVFKGKSANHQLNQLLGFRVGSMDKSSDDLLDTFTYGVALGLGSGEGV